MGRRRLYGAVALAAAVVHLGALWNHFALDDVTIITVNPTVHSLQGLWTAFTLSYWGGNLSTTVYRPLAIASFALDWQVGSTVWFHAVNILWHVAATVLVAVLARRWAGDTAGLVAGLVFAVHPVHVEAVAYVVGRSDLMATCFTLLAVYAAVEVGSVWWSAVAFALGMLSKESAVVAPALVAGVWIAGIRPLPAWRRVTGFAVAAVLIGVGYTALRLVVFRQYGEGLTAIAPIFMDLSPVQVRITAVAGLADAARLLLLPVHLSTDYSPLERTAVTSALDVRFIAGAAALGAWGATIVLAWRAQRRKVEAFGLAWVGVAYSPVANLVFPIGVFVAERLLYLPSAGLAIAVGAALRNLRGRALALAVGVLVLAGGVRSAVRVPAFRDNVAAAQALLRDAPQSYWTHDFIGWQFLWARRPDLALTSFQQSAALFPKDTRVYLAAADAAFTLGHPALADSLLATAERVCARCLVSYHNQAMAARLRGDSASADSLLAHAARVR
ncbi:MAG TPA: hypothetical protein VMH88_13545 [Gemmatimonadales bacterium]|nr:hypothetical protein [Gemmatimonadales bacterium]